MRVIYFSSVSENTHRFVQKLNLEAQRIPLTLSEGELDAQGPYILITPTYGGGHPIPGKAGGYVPKQVIRFLNRKENRECMQGVIVGGNTNFGAEYGYAGLVISRKCHVPLLYRFELMGTPEDVKAVRDICMSQLVTQ